MREVVRQFRAWRRPASRDAFFERISVATWYREPDFGPNYRRLWELEQELSDVPGLHIRTRSGLWPPGQPSAL